MAGFVAAIALFAVSPLVTAPARAASPVRFSGELSGLVTDVSGKPQPGAVVLLFNRQDRLLQKSFTDELGSFSFGELMPDLYSVQVSLANFIPAMKERVQIKTATRSLLSINLSKVFSSVQLVSMTPLPGGLMTDNWKWAVRTDPVRRPILRILPAEGVDSPEEAHSSVFSDSRGLIRVSASDGAQLSSTGEADLGTQFAFATSVYGGNRFAVAGNLGYAPISGGTQSAAFRTTYSREFASGAKPEVSFTMRQFYMPMRMGQAMAGSPLDSGLPALRTMGVSLQDKTQITDTAALEYGFEMDSVSFLNRLQYFSPYAKLTQTLDHGQLDFTWTSGNARPELGMSSADANADLQRDLASLAALPRITLAGGQAKVQRGEDFELGLSQRYGSREYRVSAYYDDVANTTLTIANPSGDLFVGDLLPDLFSSSALFNAGRFQTVGFNTSVTQDLGQNYKITLIFGRPGVLAPETSQIRGTTADDLRNVMETTHRPAVTLRASGTVKCTGTRFVASYQWTNYQSAIPGPLFATESARPEPGFNIALRQPIPSFPGMPWRMEASAELRNLLAQGYLPLSMPDGQMLTLVNTPRSIRGGLAFVF